MLYALCHLRRIMKKKRLRSGFTTGTAAAAAAKAAVLFLLEGRPPDEVSIALLTGDRMAIPDHSCRRTGDGAECSVIKDAGDDPDVTHGAEIGAAAKLLPAPADSLRVVISGGEGVGRITKPGLELPPGEAAINPCPRRMITEAVGEALIVVAILYIIPVHPLAFLIFQTFSTAYNVYGHCGREFYPAGMPSHWLGRWLNTSTAHAVHHSAGHYNYSFYFMFWDRLMKTADPACK